MSKQFKEKQRLKGLRNSYLNPSGEDKLRVIETLADVGVIVDRKGRLHWPSKKHDFEVFDEIMEYLLDTSHFSDEEFLYCIDSLMEIAKKSDWFQIMDDESIVREVAHKNFTPFEHSFNVLGKLKTGNLDPQETFFARFNAVFHDLGKLAIAKGDYYQDHAKISMMVIEEYFKSRGYFEEELFRNNILSPIWLHHYFELIDRGVMTEDDLFLLMPSPIAFIILGLLTMADTSSLEKDRYRFFAITGAKNFLEMLVNRIDLLRKERGKSVYDIKKLVEEQIIAIFKLIEDSSIKGMLADILYDLVLQEPSNEVMGS